MKNVMAFASGMILLCGCASSSGVGPAANNSSVPVGASPVAATSPTALVEKPDQAVPAVPPQLCTPMMRSWCVLNSGRKIERENQDKQWVWQLTDTYFADGPVVIIADKICDDVDINNPRKLYERQEQDKAGKKYLAMKYGLESEGLCTLEFRLPILGDQLKPLYRSTVLTSVRLCSKGVCNMSLNDLEPRQQ